MRCCRKHDQSVGFIRKKLRQLFSLRMLASLCDIVRLVDYDDIPPCVFQMGTVIQIILQRIH